MYSSLNDYLSSPDPEVVEKGLIIFIRDYGIEDTIEEIWNSVLSPPILGLGYCVEMDNKIHYPFELELPNHELRLYRIEKDDNLMFVREERIDNDRERKEGLDVRMTKPQYLMSLRKRLDVKYWALGSLKSFLKKVVAWHQIDL